MLYGTKKSLQTNKGRRSAERRILRDRSAQSERCRWAGSRRASPFGGRARLPALYRGSRQVFRLGSVRSRASWSRITDPRPGQPAPGRPASWPAGRVSEPPERSLRNRVQAPRSLHLQDRIRNVPFDERAWHLYRSGDNCQVSSLYRGLMVDFKCLGSMAWASRFRRNQASPSAGTALAPASWNSFANITCMETKRSVSPVAWRRGNWRVWLS